MDNAQKAIMIGVGLFITIIIISVVLLVTNLGQGLSDDATGTLSGIGAELESQLISRYDKKTVTGTEVKAAYDNYGSTVVIISNGDGSNTAKIAANYKGEVSDTGVVTFTEI